jgi:hypothetical protein
MSPIDVSVFRRQATFHAHYWSPTGVKMSATGKGSSKDQDYLLARALWRGCIASLAAS